MINNMDVQNAMIQLSGVCNFRCRMCGHARKNFGFMSKETFERTITDCNKCNIHTIIYAGAWGEPTLHPNWKKFIHNSVRLGFNTILSTNASRFNPDTIKFLSTSGIKTLQISFSGYDKRSYESIYINGHFRDIRKVLNDLKISFEKVQCSPTILINGVCGYPQSTFFVDKTYKFLYSLGYSDYEINIVRPNNFGGKVFNVSSSKKYLSKKNLHLCTVIRDVVGINWDGKVTACACLDNEGEMIIGDIKISSIDEIRKSKYYKRIVECFTNKDLAKLKMCSKCDVPYGQQRNVKILPSWL